MLRFSSTYQVIGGDDLGSADFWNVRFQDLDVRLNAVEGFTNIANNASQQIISAGIARINDFLQPAVNTATTDVNTLTATVALLQSQVITDQNSLNSQLLALLSEGQTYVANLISGGVIDGGSF